MADGVLITILVHNQLHLIRRKEAKMSDSQERERFVPKSKLGKVMDGIKNFTGKPLFIVLMLVIIIAVPTIIFRIGWVTFIDNYELGFSYDRFSGEIKKLDRTGYIIRWPIKYKIHAIDLRPYQLSITATFGASSTSGIPSRVLNAKLVKFNPDGLMIFVAWHGRDAGDELENLQEIMKCYAFDKESGKDCPFITVLDELNPSQTPAPSGPTTKPQ